MIGQAPTCHARVIGRDWKIRPCDCAPVVQRPNAYPYPSPLVWWCAKHDPASRFGP